MTVTIYCDACNATGAKESALLLADGGQLALCDPCWVERRCVVCKNLVPDNDTPKGVIYVRVDSKNRRVHRACWPQWERMKDLPAGAIRRLFK